MRRIAIVSGLALLASACSNPVEEHAERTGNAIAADVHDATNNFADRVDALADRIDSRIGNATDRAIDEHADRVEARVRNETDRAADEAGAALQRFGDRLRTRDRDRPAEAPAERAVDAPAR